MQPETAVIRGVLFDIGGVFVRTPFEMLDIACDRRGIDVPWRGPFDPSSDPLFARVADGTMTERDYWSTRTAELAQDLGAGDPERVMAAIFDAHEQDVLRSELLDLAHDLHAAGMAVGLLTNDLAKFHGSDWRSDLPALADFDVLVDLSHTDTLKPHPEAYRLGIEALGLEPAEVLFVDDQPVNVTGARALGMPAVHFDVVDPVTSIAEIRALTGLVATG